MTALLGIMETDILISVLKFLIKPAQRIVSQRAVKASLTPCQPLLEVLAHAWSSGEDVVRLLDLNPELTIKFQFYRSSSSTVTTPSIKDMKPPLNKKQKLENEVPASGLVVVTLDPQQETLEKQLDHVSELVHVYNVPDSHRLELLHKVRVANALVDGKGRTDMLAVRFLSLAVLSNILSEEQAQSKIFLFEPELISQLAQIVGSEKVIPPEVAFSSLICLDSLAHYRTKLSETLSAINAGANHGLLMQHLRKILASFESDESVYSLEYIEVFFTFLSFVSNTQSGGTLLNSAGLVPALAAAIGSKSKSNMKHVAKCATMLDNTIYGFPTTLNAFTNCDGVDITVKRIADEVQFCLKLGELFSELELEPSAVIDPGASERNRELVSRMPLLRAILKLILHLLQSSGGTDGIRNLIDSTLLKEKNFFKIKTKRDKSFITKDDA